MTYLEETRGKRSGEAHDHVTTELRAFDTRVGASASLLALVTERSLVEAIKTNAFVVSHLAPSEAQELAGMKSWTQVDRHLTQHLHDRRDCLYRWAPGGKQKSRFAIKDYDPARAAVSVVLGIEPACESARGTLTALELVLVPQAAFRADLEAAKASGQGFLMKDSGLDSGLIRMDRAAVPSQIKDHEFSSSGDRVRVPSSKRSGAKAALTPGARSGTVSVRETSRSMSSLSASVAH